MGYVYINVTNVLILILIFFLIFPFNDEIGVLISFLRIICKACPKSAI
jgi:hypothetical protein